MRNDYYTNSKDYINRWVVSYADFVTMLLALFMVLYAILHVDNQKLTQLNERMQKTFHSKNYASQSQQQIQNNLESNLMEHASFGNIKNSQALEKLFKTDLTQNKAVKLIREKRGLIIRINDKMLFEEGAAQIRPEAQKTFSSIIKVLTKIDNPVIIEGHTDTIPIKNAKYPSNWELSTARATNIISYVVKNGGISPKRLCAVGYGEHMPIADNTSISGRMLNRRVDIIVLDK